MNFFGTILVVFSSAALIFCVLNLLFERISRKYAEVQPSKKRQDFEIAKFKSLTSQLSPDPIWVSAPSGNVLWANSAAKSFGPNLFGILDPTKEAPDSPITTSLTLSSTEVHHFEISVRPISGAQINFARPINKLVEAQNARQDYLHSLSMTFSELSTGLAIFDRSQTLASFNPALLEITGLSFAVLSSRPHLFSFIDHLRDKNLIPEPKDYPAWRSQWLGCAANPESDAFVDIWELSGNETLKVTCRPHNDGALTLMFEDVSQETRKIRSFMNERDQLFDIVDALEEGVAVFDQHGILKLTNNAYQGIWGHSENQSNTELTLQDCKRIWQLKTNSSQSWRTEEIDVSDKSTFSFTKRDGQQLDVTASVLPGNFTLVRFTKGMQTESLSERPKLKA